MLVASQAVQDVARSPSFQGKMAVLDVKAQSNACGDAGAKALCDALIELRESNVASVRAIHLWKNELGDPGACAVAELVLKAPFLFFFFCCGELFFLWVEFFWGVLAGARRRRRTRAPPASRNSLLGRSGVSSGGGDVVGGVALQKLVGA